MKKQIETVVFVVEDDKATEPFWNAFKNRAAIYGMRPIAVGAGDQMTTPSEIADELRCMDADNLCLSDIRELIKQARAWHDEQMRELGLPASE